MIDVASEFSPGEVLLIGTGTRKSEVVRLGSGKKRLEHIGVAIPVRDAVASRERVAEDKDAPRGRVPGGIEIPIASKTLLIGAKEITTRLVGDAGADSGNESKRRCWVVFEALACHKTCNLVSASTAT